MPSLVYQLNNARKVFPLFKKVSTIGSNKDNDLVLEHPEISETHALIHFDGQRYHIQQSGRKSSIYINGKKKRKAILSHGDEIHIGPIALTFYLQDEPRESSDRLSQEKLEAYRKLYAFSQKLSQDYDVNHVLETLMDYVIELCKADKGFLLLANGRDLDIKVARNMTGENILNAQGQVSDSIIQQVIKTKQPLIVSDALHDKQFNRSLSVIHLKLCSVMCVPLLDHGALLGVIYVGNDNVVNLFTQEHLELLSIFAAQASLIVAHAILVNDLQLKNKRLEKQLDAIRFGSIIGTSEPMQEVFRKVEKVAQTDITVLIQGETGTGKELIAREIHLRSPRASGPFVTLNCGAIPENLLESELFGHVRGAFTGANTTRPGKFQLAHRGTFFLDEIGEMPHNLQVKLLRVLQEREVTKVGGSKPEYIDIRVVAATHIDLEKAVAEGRFREDLYYRLNVVNIHLPPLRERGEDVILIAQYLLQKYCKEYGVPPKTLSPEAATAMRKYKWPGNIRQLENRIKKAVILSERAALSAEDLDLLPEVLTGIKPLAVAKEEFQRRYINEVLAINHGNRTKTAKDLGVDPRTIFRHLEKEPPKNKK